MSVWFPLQVEDSGVAQCSNFEFTSPSRRRTRSRKSRTRFIVVRSLFSKFRRLCDLSRPFSNRTRIHFDPGAAPSFGHSPIKYSAAYNVQHRRSRSRNAETRLDRYTVLRNHADTFHDRQRLGSTLKSCPRRRLSSSRSRMYHYITHSICPIPVNSYVVYRPSCLH